MTNSEHEHEREHERIGFWGKADEWDESPSFLADREPEDCKRGGVSSLIPDAHAKLRIWARSGQPWLDETVASEREVRQ